MADGGDWTRSKSFALKFGAVTHWRAGRATCCSGRTRQCCSIQSSEGAAAYGSVRAPSPTNTNGAQKNGCAVATSPASAAFLNSRIARASADASGTWSFRANSIVRTESSAAAPDATGQCDTSNAFAPASVKLLARPVKLSPRGRPSEVAVLQAVTITSCVV